MPDTPKRSYRKKDQAVNLEALGLELGNKPPQALDVEEAVLGAMLVEPSTIDESMEELTRDCFYDPRHRMIFEAMAELVTEHSAIDLVTVSEKLRAKGNLGEIGGPVALANLSQKIGAAAHIEYYIKILKQKTIQRDLITASHEILKQSYDDSTNVDELMKRPYIDDFSSNYMKIGDGKFHIYKMTLDNRKVERLTDGCEDDFDPVEAPDGSVVFMSTRRGGYGRCHGHYEPLNVHTLHRLNHDKSVTTLSYHETNEWQPSFLQDGRILYTRWDYVDRAASKHHGLWTTNPDGTNSSSLFGNYTFDVNACYQAKAVPDSNKVMFLGGSHHLDVGGTILLFDPSKMRYDPESGKIVTDQTKISKDDKSSGIRSASDAVAETLIKNTYKTLLTRGQKGCFIYCEDKNLAEYIRALISQG